MNTKIYLVDFIEYTNYSRETVSNQERNIGDEKYLHVSKEGFLVREEHLDYVKQYGKGIRSIKLVGELFEMPRPNYIMGD